MNEAYIVLHSPKKGVKPVSTAAYADRKDAEKWAKDLGGKTMIVKKKMNNFNILVEKPLFLNNTQYKKLLNLAYKKNNRILFFFFNKADF